MASKRAAPAAVQVNERTFVMRATQFPTFARNWAQGREAAVPLTDVGSIADLNPNDPRDSGYAGVLPNSYGRAPVSRLFRLYKQDGTFARVVDQIAEDTWGEGWTLATKNEAWVKKALEVDRRLNVRGHMETTDKWHLIGGTALLYLYLDAAGEAFQDPTSVTDVFHLKAVPRTRIRDARIGDDPNKERFDEARAYVLGKRDGGQQTAHWKRVLEFRQYPDPDSDWEGISIGARIHDDARMKRNVEWAAVTAYGQRSAPLLKVKVREGAKIGQTQVDDMDAEMKKLQSHVSQYVIEDNFEVEPLTGTSQLPDPMSWWLMAIRSLAVTTGIPAHIIAGMATGELASSQEDTRRWHSRVSRRQENFAAPIVRQWYERLADWGLIPPMPEDFEVQWSSLGEPTAKEAMEIEELRGRTVRAYREAGVQPPALVVEYTPAELPASSLPPLAPRPAFSPPPALEALDEAALPPAQRIQVSTVKRVEARVEAAVLDAFNAYWRKWEPTLDAYIQASAETAKDGKPGVTLQADLARDLKAGVLHAYNEATRQGIRDAIAQMGADQAILDASLRVLMEQRGVDYFRTVSRLTSIDTARRITTVMRQVAADGLRAGHDVATIRAKLQETWTDLAKYEASRIARTETMTAYNAGHVAAMQANGVKEFEFLAYPGADYGDPDGPCIQRDGRRFPVGSEDDTPPLHPQCRCTVRSVVPEEA